MARFWLFGISFLVPQIIFGQQSIAREWNEVLLEAIRNDYARPNVHARNLYHTSAAMYDAWAAYDDVAKTVFLGNTWNGVNCACEDVPLKGDKTEARRKAISYAAYRLLNHRFRKSPGKKMTREMLRALMAKHGYKVSYVSTNYRNGNPAALGNYIAKCLMDFGHGDGSNEIEDYENRYYAPVNPMLIPDVKGTGGIKDPNRWQPLGLELMIDQSGNRILGDVPQFLGPEWGSVVPFALGIEDSKILVRDGNAYRVYHDPGPPPYLSDDSVMTHHYKWGFELVSVWAAHHDTTDSTMWDISPASIGNIPYFPSSLDEYKDYYKFYEGGDPSQGHRLNPHTGKPYEPQIVPRADYTRVLAEFWADGPDSETPPGHWFTILNYVNDHPLLEKRFAGQGEILSDLEWDVKSYLALGGAMHDAAITAWGIKGWYDYVRPISALRYMASKGQSTSPELPNYSPEGIRLVDGFIEQITEKTGLGQNPKNYGRIKLFTWKGPDYILDPKRDTAGVGWILADDWWPYQRPTFVTPPFAGYVSGHSTYSRAAAEVMTLLTGDEFFPGGMGEFHAKKNEFLTFEKGPTMDITLQWATYRDASDQTSLSRIWGGIHPPADDIPGRIIGEKVGIGAFHKAASYFGTDSTVDGTK